MATQLLTVCYRAEGRYVIDAETTDDGKPRQWRFYFATLEGLDATLIEAVRDRGLSCDARYRIYDNAERVVMERLCDASFDDEVAP